MRTLETNRLILRSWREDDLDDMYEYASVEGVGENAGWPHHTDKEVSKQILHSFMEKDDVYALVLKESGKVIGSLGIHDKSRDSYSTKIQREIGYVLAKPYWGQGLMTEAVTAAIRYAFEEIGVETLWCGHFSVNDRSRRVIEKTGFRFYGTGKYHAEQLGKVFDDCVYRITASDYFSESFEPFRK